MQRLSGLALACGLLTSTGWAQATDDGPVATRTRRVVAGERYRASAIHRLFLGTDYRALWTAPIEVEEVDLQRFAGGLSPVRRVGSMQTLGLAMKGNDGRNYTFRGIDKDITDILPEGLRGTFAEHLVQDQIAASHPAGALVVARLAEAAGVPHTDPILVVLPDDPALGEFRQAFAGVLGTLEVYPGAVSETNPGFYGATEILGHKELWQRLLAGPEDRVDARALLRARLLDLLVGDWDRHRGQWRWAHLPGSLLWRPLPEDRDLAFANYEGLTLWAARLQAPRLITFRGRYPSMEGLTWNGWDQDRYLLTGLEKPVWDEIAADLQHRITDAVIEDAVRKMPPEYYALVGAEMVAKLEKRRDGLRGAAARFYRHLAGEVDVHCTDRDETVEIARLPGGDVEVSVALSADAASPSPPYYRRRFHRDETHEVRVYLHGGDDHVHSSGPAGGGVRVRVIGGEGADTVDDSASGGIQVSDAHGKTEVKAGPGTHLDTRPYEWPHVNPRAPWIPPRDWGSRTAPTLLVGYGTDYGAIFGAGFDTRRFGFRADPYASRHRFDAGYAVGVQRVRVRYFGEHRFSNSPLWASVAAMTSGVERLRFYGFGNQTSSEGPAELYEMRQQQYSFFPELHYDLARSFDVSLGLEVKYSTTNLDPETLLGQTQPYGTGDFGQLGARVGLKLDTRNENDYRSGGVALRASGTYYAEAWDVESAFGSLKADAEGALPIGGRLQLAARLGGEKVFGDFPFHEAAYLGGQSLRGFRINRFAGDAAAYGSLEVRLTLGKAFLLLPGEVGILGLGDVGRVFLEGESSSKWHTSAGGGIYFAVLSRSTVLTLTVAKSEEDTTVLLRLGL